MSFNFQNIIIFDSFNFPFDEKFSELMRFVVSLLTTIRNLTRELFANKSSHNYLHKMFTTIFDVHMQGHTYVYTCIYFNAVHFLVSEPVQEDYWLVSMHVSLPKLKCGMFTVNVDSVNVR